MVVEFAWKLKGLIQFFRNASDENLISGVSPLKDMQALYGHLTEIHGNLTSYVNILRTSGNVVS